MLRIGLLGAARIAPAALIKPATAIDEVSVVTMAARDRAKAEAFAKKHGVPNVLPTYRDVVESPDVDAIYVPLPNGLHAEWTIAALRAGKHVLCEKPFTSNEPEARQVAAVAEASGLVLMEAFHWRYHPLAARMLEIVASGELGPIRHVEAALCFPLPKFSDIRWQLDLAGGSLMDAGCYPVHMVRTLAGQEPTVVSARMKEHSPGVDRWARADFRFPEGFTGRITTAMWSAPPIRTSAKVVGEAGTMNVFNPTQPQAYHRLRVRTTSSTRRERVQGYATYRYQLEAFTEAVLRGGPVLTPPADSIANMAVIDDIYRRAGLAPRPSSGSGTDEGPTEQDS